MNLDSVSTSTSDASEPVRQPYQAPCLTVFGSVARLTETGSKNGMEDGWENDSCANFPPFGWYINMEFNMC